MSETASDWIPAVLHHWTEGDMEMREWNLGEAEGGPEDILAQGFSAGVYLTAEGNHPIYNGNITEMRLPVRIDVDTSFLDPVLLGPDEGAWDLDEQWSNEHRDAGRGLADIDARASLTELGNVYYKGAIPAGALSLGLGKDGREHGPGWTGDAPQLLRDALAPAQHIDTQETRPSL